MARVVQTLADDEAGPPGSVGATQADGREVGSNGAAGAVEWIGPWGLVEARERGGAAEIWRAVHVATGESVAIRLARGDEPEHVAAIEREARALARCEHPGIARLRERGTIPRFDASFGGPSGPQGVIDREPVREPDELPFLVTDWLDGPTLAEQLRWHWHAAGPFAAAANASDPRPRAANGRLARVLGWLVELCDALAHLHGRGLIHGALQPTSIFLVGRDLPASRSASWSGADRVGTDNPRVRPVIADLQRAELVGQPEWLPMLVHAGSSRALGMAPEQILGRRLDGRSDLYSLGCIAYEAITGRPPFVARDRSSLLGLHLDGALVPASVEVAQLPPALDRLLVQLLAKDPRQRPAHARAVAHELDRVRIGLVQRDVELESIYVGPVVGGSFEVHRHVPPTVGRASELARLHAAVDALVERSSGARLALRGPAGIGKSHLLAELVVYARRHGVETWIAEGHADAGASTGMAAPFITLAEPLRAWLSEAERACTSSDPGRRHLLALVGDPYGAAVDERTARSALPVGAERQRLVRAACELARARARRRPTLLIIDAIEQADELTRALVGALDQTSIGARALLIAVAGRSLDGVDLDSVAGEPITIPELDPGSRLELLAGALGSEPLPPAALAPVTGLFGALEQGSPWHLLERLDQVLDDQRLQRNGDGFWFAQAGACPLGLDPASPEQAGIVGRRLDDLHEQALALLSTFALLGRELEASTLARVHEPRASFERRLAELMVARLVSEVRPGRLRITSALVQERARARAPERVHERILALADRDPRLAAELGPLELARHAEAAGRFARARASHVELGEAALQRGAYELAAELFARALALLGRPDAAEVRSSELASSLPHDDEVVQGRAREHAREHQRTTEERAAVPLHATETSPGVGAPETIDAGLDGTGVNDLDPPEASDCAWPDDEVDHDDERDTVDVPRLLRREPSSGWSSFELDSSEAERRRRRHRARRARGPGRDAWPRIASSGHPAALELDPVVDRHAPISSDWSLHLRRRLHESQRAWGELEPFEHERGPRWVRCSAIQGCWTIVRATIGRCARRSVPLEPEAREARLFEAMLEREIAERSAIRGELARALASAARARLLAAEVGPGSLELIAAEHTLIRTLDQLGLHRLADRTLDEQLERASRPISQLERAHVLHFAGVHAWTRGCWELGRERLQAAVGLLVTLEQRPRELRCRALLGLGAWLCGREGVAEDELAALRVDAERLADVPIELVCRAAALGIAMDRGLARPARAEGLPPSEPDDAEALALLARLAGNPADRLLAEAALARRALHAERRALARAHVLRACGMVNHFEQGLARLDGASPQALIGLGIALDVLAELAEPHDHSLVHARAGARAALRRLARGSRLAGPRLAFEQAREAAERGSTTRAREHACRAESMAAMLDLPNDHRRVRAWLRALDRADS